MSMQKVESVGVDNNLLVLVRPREIGFVLSSYHVAFDSSSASNRSDGLAPSIQASNSTARSRFHRDPTFGTRSACPFLFMGQVCQSKKSVNLSSLG